MHTLLHSVPPTLQHAISNPHLYWRLLETCRQVWVSFLWGSLLLSPGSWCAKDFCALQESVSPVLCKLWHFYGGVNGNLLQEGLCHTQVCSTHSLCPCSRPLLTSTSTEDTQTQFWLSLCVLGVCFVPFPGLSSSGDQVLGEHTVPGGPCILISSQVPTTRFPRCTTRALSQVCCMSPLES